MRKAKLVAVGVGLGVWSLFAPVAAMATDGWTDVGAAGRPAWVRASAERRLRLLSALPGIHDALHDQAQGYFGARGPGLAVGLVLDDGLYYSEGFGFADRIAFEPWCRRTGNGRPDRRSPAAPEASNEASGDRALSDDDRAVRSLAPRRCAGAQPDAPRSVRRRPRSRRTGLSS